MTARRDQRGVAMLTAILLVALAAILATAIAFHTGLSARRAASSFTVEQGLEFGAGAEYLAAYALAEDVRQSRPRSAGTAGTTGTAGAAGTSTGARQDFPGEQWNMPFPETEVAPGITLAAKLDDESGKFNLNSLLGPDGMPDPDAVQLFVELLGQLKLETRWANLIVDWIDTDLNPQNGGAEDNVYTLQKPPYRTANQYITSISELMSLPEFGAERFRKLAPHVSALPPESRAINVCFASPALLDAIESHYSGTSQTTYGGMTEEQFAQARSGTCFPGIGIISRQTTNATQQQQLKARISEESRYFRLHTWVTIGTTRFALYSLMKRDNTQVSVLSRTFGTE